MNNQQILLLPPTFGDYTMISISNDYHPNKYFSFAIGRIGYIPHVQQPGNSVTDKSMNNPYPSKSTLNRQSSDRNLKDTTLYLYYLLLLLNENTEFTVHTNERKISSDVDCLKNFICESIKINDQVIFKEKQTYVIITDAVKKIKTIQFDDDTQIPIVGDECKKGIRKYTVNER